VTKTKNQASTSRIKTQAGEERGNGRPTTTALVKRKGRKKPNHERVSVQNQTAPTNNTKLGFVTKPFNREQEEEEKSRRKKKSETTKARKRRNRLNSNLHLSTLFPPPLSSSSYPLIGTIRNSNSKSG